MVTKGLAGPPTVAGPSRIYAIGDVHGQAERLRAMHAIIRRDLRDNPVDSAALVHLGDYIDRGPASAECVALLADAAPIAGVPTINLMGNHERMLLDALTEPRRAAHWLDNGGVTALESWGIHPASSPETWRDRLPANHIRFLAALRLTYAVGNYVFVHAGVRPGIRLKMQSELDLLWIRREFLEWDGAMLPEAPHVLIVHGHTPVDAPEIKRNRICVDTNAARGGKLTCAALSQHSVYFLQV